MLISYFSRLGELGAPFAQVAGRGGVSLIPSVIRTLLQIGVDDESGGSCACKIISVDFTEMRYSSNKI